MASKDKAQILVSIKDDVSKGLKDIQKGIGGLKDGFNGLSSGISSSVVGVKGLIGAFAAIKGIQATIQNIGASFDFSDKLNDLSEQFGMSAEQLSKLDYIAGQNGTTFETLQKGYTELSKNIALANTGNTDAIDKFKQLGISVKDANGQLKTTDQVFGEVADAFQKGANDPVKLATSLEIMGKAGRELIPTLNGGSEGLQQLRDEADRLGITVSTKTAAQIGKLGDSFDTFAKVSRNGLSGLISTVAPGLDILLKGLIEFKAQIGGSFSTAGMDDAQIKIAEFALMAVDAFDSVSGYIIGPLKKGFDFLKESAELVIGGVQYLFNEFKGDLATNGLDIATVLNGVAGAFTGLFEVAKGVFKSMIEAAKIFGNGITSIFGLVGKGIGGVAAAIAAAARGDLAGAGAILKESLIDGVNTINQFGDKTAASLGKIVYNIGTGVGNGVAAISLIGDQGVKSLKDIQDNSTKIGAGIRKSMGFDSALSDAENLRKSIAKTNSEAAARSSGGAGKIGQTPDKGAKAAGDKAAKEAEKELDKLLKLNDERIKAEQKNFDYLGSLNDALYKSNFKTVEQYYDQKELLQNQETETLRTSISEQISLIENRLNSNKNDLKLQKDLVVAQEKLLDVERKNSVETINFQNEKKKALESYINDVRTLQSEINKLTGTKDTIEIDIKFNDLREKYKNDTNALSKIEELEDLTRKSDGYNKSLTQLDMINRELAISEKEIDIARDSGSKTALESFAAIKAARTDSLVLLQKELALTESLAQSPDQKLRIRELNNEINDLKNNIDPLAKQLNDSFESSFSTFFSDVAKGTKSIKDSFKDLVGSISDEILGMATKDLAKQFYRSIFGDGQSAGSYVSQILQGAYSVVGSSSGGKTSGGSGGGIVDGITSLFSSGSSSGGGSSGGGFWGSILSGIGSYFGGMDTGGTIGKNQPRLVGEFGKELFVPRASGMLLNANQTNDFMGGGRGQTIINNIQNIQTADANSFKNSKGQIYSQQNAVLGKYMRYA